MHLNQFEPRTKVKKIPAHPNAGQHKTDRQRNFFSPEPPQCNNLTLDSVLSRASIPLAQKIEYSINLKQKSESLALHLDPVNGFLCPMSNYKSKLRDIRQFPHSKKKWIETIQWLIDNGYINHNFKDAETGFRWWISGNSFEKFYADEFLQLKIDFEP